MAQIPIPGGPARRGPDTVQRAQEASHLRQARPAPEGPEGEKRPEIVDKTRLSAELTEELSRSGDPQANADQVIQGIQGLDPTRVDQPKEQKTNEIGSTKGIDGDSRKRSPRVDQGKTAPRVQQAQRQQTPVPTKPAEQDRTKDRVDYSAELKEQASAA